MAKRNSGRGFGIILVLIIFVLLVMVKSLVLLNLGTSGEKESSSEPAIAAVEVRGHLIMQLPEGRDRRLSVREAFMKPTPASESTVENLIRRQASASYLQIIFREPALPLPFDEFSLSTEAPAYDDRRATVTIPYVLAGHVVAPAASLAESAEELGEVGGTHAETFIVPADPRNLFQRLGYACANQDEIPLGLVDDRNYGNYFDPKCAQGVPVCEHPDGLPLEPCLDVLARENGVGTLYVRMERIAYDPAIADASAAAHPRSVGGADISVDAEKLKEHDIIYKYFAPDSCAVAEGCVGGPGMRRLLRFSAVTPNLGDKDLAFGDVDTLIEKTNQFAWSQCHGHYHFNGYGEFSLEKDGQRVLPGAKQSFCVESTGRAANAADVAFTTPYASCENQGISAGWEDEYFIGLDCQWIDITDLKIEGESQEFSLAMEVNPLRLLCEGEAIPGKYVPALDDEGKPVLGPSGKPALKQACKTKPGFYANDKASVTVNIPKTGGAVTAECDTLEYGPLRDCGWRVRSAAACTPGETVRAVTPSALVRACAGTTPCAWAEALATADGGAVSFRCPDSGSYSLMTAPYATWGR